MRKGIVGIVILLWVAVLGLSAPTYTVTPWPYGAIVWVQTPPENAQSLADCATGAVQDVFRFWGLPLPAPAGNWAHPVQTSAQAWNQGMMAKLQSPSVPLAELLNPDYSLVHGTPLPEAGSDTLLIIPAPSWGGEKIPPMIIGVYPDYELMDAACGDYSIAGLYGPPVPLRDLMLQGATGPSASLVPILASKWDIIISRGDDWRFALYHELAHWATHLACMEMGIDFDSLPPVIKEGIADYTAHRLLKEEGYWKAVAAAWGQAGGELTHVPPPLYYDVGTSVVSYLVARRGREGFLHSLSAFAADWGSEAARIAPGWRTTVGGSRLSESDRALYEAELERLGLCAWLLDPVISPEARRLITRIYADQGKLSDIDAFWNIISAVPPRPSEDSWDRLARREGTFRLVQYRDGDRSGTRMARARVEVNLREYRENGDWQDYYTWFIRGLGTVIAAWGKVSIRRMND